MISLVLLLTLAWSFYIGYSRGLVLQGYYAFASLVSMFVSAGRYQSLSGLFYLWVPYASATEGASTYYFSSQHLFSLDKVFYAGLAYLTIYTVVYVVMRLIGIFVHLVRFVTPSGRWASWVSGFLSVGVTLFSLQMVLTIAATIPIDTVQNSLHESWLSNAIIQYVPITTNMLKQLWVTNILG